MQTCWLIGASERSENDGSASVSLRRRQICLRQGHESLSGVEKCDAALLSAIAHFRTSPCCAREVAESFRRTHGERTGWIGLASPLPQVALASIRCLHQPA